jgi:hypothetical protein
MLKNGKKFFLEMRAYDLKQSTFCRKLVKYAGR